MRYSGSRSTVPAPRTFPATPTPALRATRIRAGATPSSASMIPMGTSFGRDSSGAARRRAVNRTTRRWTLRWTQAATSTFRAARPECSRAKRAVAATTGSSRKMDANGEHVWTRQFGGEDDDTADAIAVDAGGTVFVAGNTESSIPGAGGAGSRGRLREELRRERRRPLDEDGRYPARRRRT